MKVMCDTNIILDVLLERELFAEQSSAVLKLCESRKIHGYISATSITDIYYFVRKYTGDIKKTRFSIGKLLDIVAIADVTKNNIFEAYQKKTKDFEDAVLSSCTKSAGCKYVITRNISDFQDLDIPAISPENFLLKLKK